MHLKTLTLRGFKSFASATTLRLEPGITCVVGPNGSGKSNVVDALAWVMGEQGARSLRGGSMEDVVFAGTTGPRGRPALGRAEVSLTIDNSDGALPIGYAEVTLTRTMFRTGGSDYAINGSPVRLLDVTELLSDSGIGKEMHVIVGQGRLDAVLNATPHERRGFVEEAAGVLKHRKRKERALRKLESMQANLVRLSDLSAEVRRQLGPLARQADVARRAQVVQAEVRDARARLLADDLVQAQASLADDLADEQAHLARRAAAQDALTAARAELVAAQAAQAEVTPRLAAAQEGYFALHALRERLRSLHALATERERGLRPAAAPPTRSGRDVEALLADAERAREAEAALRDQVGRESAALEAASAARGAAEAALAAHERAVADAARARADARERLAGAAGQVAARSSAAQAAREEAERAAASLAAARARAAQARNALSELAPAGTRAEPGGGDGADGGAGDGAGEGTDTSTDALEAESAAASEALADAEASLARWRSAERDAERDRAGAAARAEALELGLRERRDGTGALLDHGGHLPGVLGPFAGLLRVEAGAEDVVAAALGSVADAVAVESLEVAVDALRLLRERDAGRAEIAVARPAPPARGGRRAAHAGSTASTTDVDGLDGVLDAIQGARPLLSLVSAPPQLAGTLTQLLALHVAVPDLAAARALLGIRPELVAVTADGDVLRADAARGGSPGAGGAPSRLHVQAALDSARSALAQAGARAAEAGAAMAAATAAVVAAREQVGEALAALSARDAAAAAGARALGEASGAVRAADAEAERLGVLAQRAQAAARDHDERLEQALARQAALVAQLGQGGLGQGSAPDGLAPDGAAPDDAAHEDAPARAGASLAATATAARAAEVDARLALRTAEERLRGLAGRAQDLARAARAEEVRTREATARAAAAAAQLAVVAAVRAGSATALAVARQSLLSAGLHRDDAETDAAVVEDRLVAARDAAEALAASLAELTDSVHRDELVRAERTARVDALRARAVEELAIDPDDLVAELGPDRPVPVLAGQSSGDGQPGDDAPADDEAREAPAAVPYVRSEQETRLLRATRDLARLGRVNPLALEEFAALEERSAFLTSQLDDLRTARADLLDIVAEIDERVQEVFASAFADTATAFEAVFARLFPGGEGRLVLTDPDDPLTTGIDVEARPAGKRVKRLGLLSGGERSLTAIAILVAIFTARPSPFYVLDEVEAALDDTNLRRLLAVLEELRASSQLIVITHQERTMEIADALYGVSMRDDGVSAVVSQRLRSPGGSLDEAMDEPVDSVAETVIDLRDPAPAPTA